MNERETELTQALREFVNLAGALADEVEKTVVRGSPADDLVLRFEILRKKYADL